MRYWLFKSEPETYGIADLARDGRTEWSGVRNYQARNTMREMRPGDRGLFYHSSVKPPGVAGICEVIAAAHPDSTQFDPESEYYDRRAKRDDPPWWCVDVGYVATLPRFVPLDELRTIPDLAYMPLLQRGQRLSVQPVTPAEWRTILRLGGVTAEP